MAKVIDPWERVRAEVEHLEKRREEAMRPPGAFTRVEFEQQMGCGEAKAHRLLGQLVKEGTLNRVGTTRGTFYVFPE